MSKHSYAMFSLLAITIMAVPAVWASGQTDIDYGVVGPVDPADPYGPQETDVSVPGGDNGEPQWPEDECVDVEVKLMPLSPPAGAIIVVARNADGRVVTKELEKGETWTNSCTWTSVEITRDSISDPGANPRWGVRWGKR